jgi:TPP-dependent trihydroxycyclohexane-1,2-dione (THcHDO) dehydratase
MSNVTLYEINLSGLCGYKKSEDAEPCRERATWHIFWHKEDTTEVVDLENSLSCDEHLKFAIKHDYEIQLVHVVTACAVPDHLITVLEARNPEGYQISYCEAPE